MHSDYLADPLGLLLVTYLFGTLVCGAWALCAQAIRRRPRRAE